MLAGRQGLRGLGRWVAAATAALGAGLILFALSIGYAYACDRL